jgi:hypothetical protein
LYWLELNTDHFAANQANRGSYLFADGGYATLIAEDAWLMLRVPTDRFRPSQADGMHLDIWVEGEVLACDAGTYSYNCDPHWLEYFGGGAAHNTIQFDGRDQMPRLSRFLFGAWLRADMLEFDARERVVAARYRDYLNAKHFRRVQLLPKGGCTVTDIVDGFRARAVIRWRLRPQGGPWVLANGVWRSGSVSVEVSSSVPIERMEIVEGWESTHYGVKTRVPVIEAEIREPGSITTCFKW